MLLNTSSVIARCSDYFSHFVVMQKVDQDTLTQELSKTPQPWIDGTCSVIKIRSHSIPFLNDLSAKVLPNGKSDSASLDLNFIMKRLH